jgi:predicted HicB family RNase H-like nuclease
MPAPTKNKNAVKEDGIKATSTVQFRCHRSDKSRWVKAAQADGLKLSEWIIQKLNSEGVL